MTRTNKADRRPDHEIAREDLSALMVRERLDVVSTFVPFSQSRNKDEKYPSLNWKVTLQRQGRDANTGEKVGPVYVIIADTNYMAGSAHCPSYKRDNPNKWEKARTIRHECETGHAFRQYGKGAPILPDPVDVFSALLLDAGVLNAGGFEEWAIEYGYDTDSRTAEATYKACLETALKLRSALGDKVMTEAQNLTNRL